MARRMDPWANGAFPSFGPGLVCSVGPILWSDVWVLIFKPYQNTMIVNLAATWTMKHFYGIINYMDDNSDMPRIK